MKLKPINKYIINGSTLMGFGIAIILLSLEFLNTHPIIGIWSLVGGFWFFGLGIYEIIFSISAKTFFE